MYYKSSHTVYVHVYCTYMCTVHTNTQCTFLYISRGYYTIPHLILLPHTNSSTTDLNLPHLFIGPHCTLITCDELGAISP